MKHIPLADIVQEYENAKTGAGEQAIGMIDKTLDYNHDEKKCKITQRHETLRVSLNIIPYILATVAQIIFLLSK